MSKRLTERGIGHVVIERDEVASSWRRQRSEAARNITLRSVSSKVSADIDVRGVLGVDPDPDVRKGFSNVDIEFEIDADCDDEQKDALLASGAKYSAVFDIMVNPTEVNISRSH